jgi:hypothetical protein
MPGPSVAEKPYEGVDPTKPWYILFLHGQAQMSSQDRERCELHATIVRRNMARREGLRAAEMESYVTIEEVAPQWPTKDRCERTDAHEPHPYSRGSPFICGGTPMSASRCERCRHLKHVGRCDQHEPWTYARSRTGAPIPCPCDGVS